MGSTVLPLHARDRIKPDFHQVNLHIESFIKNDLQIKLDTDDQICRLSLTPTGCPLGPQLCPLRHTQPSPLNFVPPPPVPVHPRDRERLNTVCKHWLRGLCKKGDQCEFLHEYNLQKMPECYWLSKYGYCSAGDECLYYHPKVKKRICMDYDRGFCFLGPACPRRHIPRRLCPLYVAGFCPLGPKCTEGAHPKLTLPPVEAYRPPTPPVEKSPGPPPPGYGRYAEWEPGSMTGMGGGGGFHRGGWNNGGEGGSGGGGGGGGGGRLDLSTILCYKCGQHGHFANQCPNRNVPGNRGGQDRTY
ncbi:hypothetical protein SERLA73DRAFT_78143 [Phaffia rhodozyma]|uniref:mRNA 3'-end-processing protein n=1 Tax=Phaffia rhodozyma TaxID=264483 RepID=A0A0F7SEY0_PHARH|nr:hypothetical protein SERLA73DRAFT_78143 [Phaffia rhodozyma]